ncbi:hypothetical protein SAMN05421595_0706 [Austwickia chelonae]|uniref:Uncharacterized protein n=1 Tax=Austwickia chelonae NBRC 105200 TaxID=1184607 RepID=K6VS70_9MICO|nr:hypothetical protein AUCHE_08_04300 [Austwickia chelonae NBRC 105200]SEV98408.1 hypothetical protein SAMN05421595_0706 [Austwickia chelonae]
MKGVDYLRAAKQFETAEGLDAWTALMRVLVARLQGMQLPLALQPALDQAASHWSGRGGALSEVKVAVWRYLEVMGPIGVDLATPAGRGKISMW